MLKLTPWFCIAALLSLTIAECGAEKWPLHIAITGASPTHGEVIVALFDSEQRFLVEPISTITQSVDDNGVARVIFENVEPGEYAVSVIYDEDGDGELARNKRGVPLEAVGFSQNAKARFGPPSFSEAAFVYTSAATIEITLIR